MPNRRVILYRVGELIDGAFLTDSKTLYEFTILVLFAGLEFKIHQGDTVLTIIRAFLLATDGEGESDVEPSDPPIDDPHNENYHRYLWKICETCQHHSALAMNSMLLRGTPLSIFPRHFVIYAFNGMNLPI